MGTINVEDIYELSPLQQGIFLHSQHDGASDMYLAQQTYTVTGSLDPELLVRAWQAVIAAHPVLRTSFHWDRMDKPLQVVHRKAPLPVDHHDWSGAGEAEQQNRLEELKATDREAGFDLTAAPLMRVNLVRLGAERLCLIWTYHHLLMDGWSISIFINDVLSYYNHFALDGPRPPEAPQFRDYIAWLQRQDPDATKAFWVNTLAGVTPSHLHGLRPVDPQHGTGSIDRRTVKLPEAVGAGIREAAARHRVTLNTIVQATWAAVLRHYTGRAEVTFGCISSGRPADLPEVDRMVGMLATTLPVRVDVPDDGDLGSWLHEIQNMYAAMRRYEYTPLADIKKWAGVPGQQLFESNIGVENFTSTMEAAGITEQVSFSQDSLFNKTNYPLTLTVFPQPFAVDLLVHRERFAPSFIDDVLERLRATFEVVAKADRIGEVTAAAGPSPATPEEPAKAVPAADHPRPRAGAIEETVADVYREILGLQELDVTASFFELGGDSFDAVRAVGRIDGASVGLLAANPAVRDLAAALGAATDAPDAELDSEIDDLERRLAEKRTERAQRGAPNQLVPVPRDETMTCSYQQEALWFMNQLEPASTIYHIPFPLRLRGHLDVDALQRTLTGLVRRHEALRTRFVNVGGRPRQVVDPPPELIPMPIMHVTPDRVDEWAAAEVARPFDLATGPVFRAAVARLSPEDYALVVVEHHIVADGWSSLILVDEMTALYATEATGRDVTLPPPTIQPVDHAAWQRRRLGGPERDRHLGFWRDTLANLSTVDFPADRPRPAQPTYAGVTITRPLPASVAASAEAYARANRVSLLAVLQATLLTVLLRYTGQRDLPVGSLFSGRDRPDLESLVGYIGNTLVLRTELADNLTFTDLVKRCGQTVLDATAHQDVPFSVVVDALAPERIAGRIPLFQIGLTFLPRGISEGFRIPQLSLAPIFVAEHYAAFDISLDIAYNDSGGIDVAVEYATDLFDSDRMQRFLGHYTTAIASGLSRPDAAVADIDILSSHEHRRLVSDFPYNWPRGLAHLRATARRLRPRGRISRVPVHQSVEAVAGRKSTAIALIDHDGSTVTYGELDRTANQLAHRLRKQGIRRGQLVGVCLPGGVDRVTAVLAAWKAGAATVPLDPGLPDEFLDAAYAETAPTLVVTTSALAIKFTAAMALDTERAGLAAEPVNAVTGDPGPDDLACVHFTTGTTGVPQGVLVPHRALSERVDRLQSLHRLAANDRVLHQTSYAYDAAIRELIWPLAAGAIVVLASGGHDGAALGEIAVNHRVTTMNLTPTMLHQLLGAADHVAGDGDLRRVFTGGEPLRADTVRRFHADLPDVELHNHYGSAETLDIAAGPGAVQGSGVPVGRPLPGRRVRILDRELRPVPIGVPGQLFVSGIGVGRGYLNRPGLTAQRFVPDPYADRPGERMFATGDLTCWRANGTIDYLGRVGQEVKLGGHRIDPALVEAALADQPGIRECAVGPSGSGRLTAYVASDADLDLPALRRRVADHLPAFMIPANVVTVPRLPLTGNGKLDRERLPEPGAVGVRPPSTGTERWLAATWQELLQVERVDVGDDFFDLGANSLHATQLVARIEDAFGITLGPGHVFANPTVDLLASQVDDQRNRPGGR